MNYRFHVIGLPHTQTTRAYSNCAFTENVRKFCIMLKALGHEVTLYASEDNEAPCDEHVTCITKAEQRVSCGVDGPATILNARYEGDLPHWRLFNQRVVEATRPRVQRQDFLAIIAGDLNQPVIDAFPQALPIEYAVGYTGISHSTKRAFPCYAWLHAVYGRYYGAHACPGRFYDRVIPHFVDPDDFPLQVRSPDDYFLFVGRLNEDKGVRIAAQTAKIVGVKLVVAGQGPIVPEGCDYRGLVGPEERAELMSQARALFVPSTYLEPFGMVAIEGLMSGAPLITTDWGGLSEINVHGETGFKCHTLADFVDAARRIDEIDRSHCRQVAHRKYTINAVAPLYQKWFDDLYGLWTTGWYGLPANESHSASPVDAPVAVEGVGVFQLFESDYISDVLREGRPWEPHIADIFRRYLRPGDTAVDVGAYIGVHTVLMARLCQPGRVLAFDPNPTSFAQLKSNLSLNRIDNVDARQLGVSDEAARTSFGWVTPGNLGAAGLADNPMGVPAWVQEGREAGTSVDVVSLDSLVLPDVRLIKIDAEGYERRVVRGCRETIERCQPIIVIECWKNHRGEVQDIEAEDSVLGDLRAAGYEVTHVLGPDFLALPRDAAR